MRRGDALVSVIVPAWNAAAWIERAIDSALMQDYEPKEIVVVDDGSTDETVEILRGYGDRVRVVRQRNLGLPAARNAGLKAARGEFAALLDADDFWLPGKLSAQAELMRTHPDVGFCSTEARVEDEHGQVVGVWRDECCLDRRSVLETIFARHAAVPGSGSAVMMRRGLALSLGGFDESLRALEDVDMWIRLAATSEYQCIRQRLAVITRRDGSMSRKRAIMKDAARRVMRKNRKLLPPDPRGSYWRWCYAGMLTDYAKWEARDGDRARALCTLAEALAWSPVGRGRSALSLAWAVITAGATGLESASCG